MAVDRSHMSGAHAAHDENLDHQSHANLAVWLGLIALTFMYATFVATNVYLRGWNPSKFILKSNLLKDLPYYNTLVLIISGLLLLLAGTLFIRNQWRGFNLVLALTTLAYVGVLATQFRLMLWFIHYSPQIGTIYGPTSVIEFLLDVISIILLIYAGWYASYANKKKLNQFFPVAMNVWLYTIVSGIVVLLVENVMTVGQFAAWCGQHIS
ncbi:hypothetical protein LLE49_04760 [Alicyclobacillus tolerans]|uniref:hypothetical protein n=1 Tax=Alicyclobacillus tolerans TaxID=90970 RepID=UPI001F20B400|nr:hypothetical protein [Alicyclobacillus tolerans]MCF8564048.1 hypothetical protein [Alicyclobacillus tolerans]